MINEGSAKAYCSEAIDLIENYEEAIADESSTWDLHHRRELTEDGDFVYSRDELKKMNLYYDRPARELVFLRHGEHSVMHHKGNKLSAEHRAKIAESMMGKNKGKKLSDDTRKKMSDAKKGMSDDTRKKMSDAKKGKKLSAEHRKKLSESTTKYWQNKKLL